ncbi:hypothetical protein Vadar_001575 [Vaccinium darrowii]|uniref:Uncharacterized protein n=1 Tax=Vaccinium darrowii TaxID=229202 RepID=A0ACB7XEP3_9ERIC|nr:hypothetical protein Vadar_001575 [Vaccinium darrowii]
MSLVEVKVIQTLLTDSEVAAGGGTKIDPEEISKHSEITKVEMTLLDLYCGCGAMLTSLCLGANTGGVNLCTISVDLPAKQVAISDCYYYCDKKYLVPYSSFVNLLLGNASL